MAQKLLFNVFNEFSYYICSWQWFMFGHLDVG